MPTIRAIRPTDLVSLIAFFRSDSLREVTASLWPEVWAASSNSQALKRLLARLLPHPVNSQVWIYLSGGSMMGLVVATPRAGKIAWDVDELFVAEEDGWEIGVDLLERISGEAARQGARKIFVAVPVEGQMARLVGRAGFANYTSESLYVAHPAGPVEVPALQARPRLRRDSQSLFHLYNLAVPCRVRSAEAMTMDEWLSLERGSRLWAPSLAGIRRHFVWEDEAGLVAWMRLSFGRTSQLLELLIHPAQREAAEALVGYSLLQTEPRLPLYLSVREYQPEIAAAALKQGFGEVSSYLIFARELAVRMPNRAFVPARA